MAAGAAPRVAPPACGRPGEQPSTTHKLSLDRYGALDPALGRVQPTRLWPIRHVLVHGSAATQDMCAFSDIDVAVFVDDSRPFSAAEHRVAVRELRRLLHTIFHHDALMHHGLMFAPATSLDAYDQRFLPLETLRNARVLHGPQTFEVRVIEPARDDAAQSLASCARSLRKHLHEAAFCANDYTFKNFLSGALLMPARVLAAHGTYVYKRESFALAKELFKPQAWDFIARCEGLRALWQRPPAPAAHRAVPRAAHPKLLQIFGARYAPRLNVRRVSRPMLEGLIQTAHLFLDRVENFA